MSYREENGQVVLTMSKHDWNRLSMLLDWLTGRGESGEVYQDEVGEVIDRLNAGNPNYTPFQVPK